MLVMTAGGTLRGGQAGGFRLHISDQIGGIIVGYSQGGHAHARIPVGERKRDRVVLAALLLRVADIACQPDAVAPLRDAAQVRAHAVARPDRVAGRTYLLEQGLAGLIAQRQARIARCAMRDRAHLIAPFRIHGADRHDEAAYIAEYIVPLPLAGRIIAEHDLVAVIAQYFAALAELVIDRPDVLRLSGHEGPSGAGAERPGILLEPLGRIVLRVDRHRNHEDVAAHEVAELLLDLRHAGGRQRADVAAAGVDEADDDDLALDQVVVEPHRLAVLG